MKAEAQANADTDRQAREKVDKLNQADSLIFQTEKQLKEYKDKIPADKVGAIEAALNELKEAHKGENLEGIDAASNNLNAAWQAASQDMYQASQQQQPGGGESHGADAGDGSDNKEDVTDVEFEEVGKK